MRVALVHEWLTNYAGSECCVAALRDAFPGSPLLTTVFYEPAFAGWEGVRTTGLQPLVRGPGSHIPLLPAMPAAWRMVRVPAADLVITSFHTFALWARVPMSAPHVVYCHTPPRFLWLPEQVTGERLPGGRRTLSLARRALRPGDRRRAGRPATWVANSATTARRVREAYGVVADVVYPPVDVDRFAAALGRPARDDFVVVSRLVPYKQVELAVEAFRGLPWPLTVAGTGRQLEALRRTAPSNVSFVGRVPDADLPALLAGARAVVLPGEEDFGILPVEAMAAGTPVVAYGRGGALETVTAGTSGLLFDEPTPTSLADAIRKVAATDWDRAAVSASVSRFATPRFRAEMSHIAQAIAEGREP
ncbi:MAG: glycosyltransferase [Acidimicrobiales bacterium]